MEGSRSQFQVTDFLYYTGTHLFPLFSVYEHLHHCILSIQFQVTDFLYYTGGFSRLGYESSSKFAILIAAQVPAAQAGHLRAFSSFAVPLLAQPRR